MKPQLTSAGRLAVALDVDTKKEAERLIKRLSRDVRVFKVGLQLFLSEGIKSIDLVQRARKDCFLDLKLHDISNTVERAVEAACEKDVRFVTVHAANGPSCLRRAARIAEKSNTILLAVTALTSLNRADVSAIGVDPKLTTEAWAVELAKMAVEAGIVGIVCSPQEVASVRAAVGQRAILVTPGIRLEQQPAHDQSRIATPQAALKAGSDMLVVGRPIRDAEDPSASARSIMDIIHAHGDNSPTLVP